MIKIKKNILLIDQHDKDGMYAKKFEIIEIGDFYNFSNPLYAGRSNLLKQV